MCAFPLFGGSRDVIAPIEKVLLMFATDAVDTGTVIEQAFTDGLMIDLTASNQRAVGYVINKGWTPTDQSWAKPVASGTDLVAMLIDKPHTNVGLRSLVHR